MSNKPMAYLEDGVITIRASAIGKCSRALWAALTEIPAEGFDDYTEQILKEGHMHEEEVRQRLEQQDYKFEGTQDEVVVWVIPNKLRIVGHTDGLIEVPGKYVWENKALGKSSFERWVSQDFTAFFEYAWQISFYMHATEREALYTVKCRDNGVLDTRVISTPPIKWEQIEEKALHVYESFQQDHEMPVCDPQRWQCSYKFLHDEVPTWKEMDDIDEKDLDPHEEAGTIDYLGAKLENLRSGIKILEAEEKETKEQLDLLVFHGLDGEANGFDKKIIRKTQTRKYLSKEKLILDIGKEAAAKYETVSTFTRWDIRNR